MHDHLTPEQLDQYRRGTAPAAELLALDDHLSQCEACRMALEKLVTPMALTQWAAGLARYEKIEPEATVSEAAPRVVQTPKVFPFKAPWFWWTPALLAALVVAVLMWKRPVPVDVANRVPPSTFVEGLNDAGGMVQLDTNGVVHVPAGMEPGREALLAEAIKARALPMAALPSDLVAAPGTLLGPSTPDEFAPIAPLSTLVYSDRPEFQWQALKAAVAYEVQVFDSEFHQVDSSGKIRETHWTPAQPLARGAMYQWQVIAYRANDSVRTPTPPAADARFRVLNAEIFGKVDAARTAAQPAHLLAAILLAKAGLKEEARRDLETLAAANPDSKLVQDLLAGLDR